MREGEPCAARRPGTVGLGGEASLRFRHGSRREKRARGVEEQARASCGAPLPSLLLSLPASPPTPSAATPATLSTVGRAAVAAKMASRRRRVLWLLFALLGSLCYYRAYGIIVQTENELVTAREFEGAYLNCKHNARKETHTRVEWKKVMDSDVLFVYFDGSFVGNFKGRAEMLHSSIQIKNVTRKDSGKYRCEISAPTDQGQEAGETEVFLLVQVPPAPPVCDVPNSAMTGTVVELQCKENEGVPASKYRWYKNGRALLENPVSWWFRNQRAPYIMNTTTGTLLFNPVSKNDTGDYYCQADNKVGRPQRCPVKRMQVDDLNVSGIIAAVVIVALIIASCGLGVYYAQKKGYFSKRPPPPPVGKKSSKYKTTGKEKDFKHTKSFII